MTMTTAARDTASRRLLLSSLALNFFFIGIIGAFATRFHFAAIHPTGRPHTAAARIEWLAERLGPADAEKLRIAFHPRETEAEHTREAVGRAYERLRETLRAEPFDSGPRLYEEHNEYHREQEHHEKGEKVRNTLEDGVTGLVGLVSV